MHLGPWRLGRLTVRPVGIYEYGQLFCLSGLRRWKYVSNILNNSLESPKGEHQMPISMCLKIQRSSYIRNKADKEFPIRSFQCVTTYFHLCSSFPKDYHEHSPVIGFLPLVANHPGVNLTQTVLSIHSHSIISISLIYIARNEHSSLNILR